MSYENRIVTSAQKKQIINEAGKLPKTEALKYDQNKPDLSLLPTAGLNGIALAFMDGETKYGRFNYLKGMEWHRLISSTLRHINAFKDGEDNTSDSNLNLYS